MSWYDSNKIEEMLWYTLTKDVDESSIEFSQYFYLEPMGTCDVAYVVESVYPFKCRKVEESKKWIRI